MANPAVARDEYLRQTLLDSMLETVARNLRFVERVADFEIGRVYLPVAGQILPAEPRGSASL